MYALYFRGALLLHVLGQGPLARCHRHLKRVGASRLVNLARIQWTICNVYSDSIQCHVFTYSLKGHKASDRAGPQSARFFTRQRMDPQSTHVESIHVQKAAGSNNKWNLSLIRSVWDRSFTFGFALNLFSGMWGIRLDITILSDTWISGCWVLDTWWTCIWCGAMTVLQSSLTGGIDSDSDVVCVRAFIQVAPHTFMQGTNIFPPLWYLWTLSYLKGYQFCTRVIFLNSVVSQRLPLVSPARKVRILTALHDRRVRSQYADRLA